MIPTNRYLHLRRIKDSPNCTFGCNEEETIVHLFYNCRKVWNEVLHWVKNNCTNCDTLSLSEQLIILGAKKNVMTDKVIDLLIITGKWHIYKCKLQDSEPRFEIFKKQFQERYIIEKVVIYLAQQVRLLKIYGYLTGIYSSKNLYPLMLYN